MPDLGNYDLVAAMRRDGCPLCRVLAEAELRWMDAFVHERGQAPEALRVFCERGGFCRSHAWQFHRRAALALTGAPVAEMYEGLLRRDIAHLEQLALDLPADRRPRRLRRSLLGRRACPACERADARQEAKAEAFVVALNEPAVRSSYCDSDGLCVQHLDLVGAAALAGDTEVARFLIQDLRKRLQLLEARLGAYERERDHWHRSTRSPIDADAWTDVVRSYVGEEFAD